MNIDAVEVRGAREHNLQGIDVSIPRGRLTTVTGVSGSGKSSLAFNTIQAEGQRRYVESLSAYARQFLGQVEKPRVDEITGLSPTVAIDQKAVNRNPRSTVGTITEIHDHLRLLFARLGTAHCASCGDAVERWTPEAIVDRILGAEEGRQLTLLATVVRARKGEYRRELEALRQKGWVRARVDGTLVRLDEPLELARYERHTIEVVLDRLRIAAARRARLAEAVEQGLALEGAELITLGEDGTEQRYSTRNACVRCGTSIPELEPRLFSFNAPQGACTACNGLGERAVVDETLVLPDEALSIDEGAVAPSRARSFSVRWQLGAQIIAQVCKALKIRTDVPVGKLRASEKKLLLHGAGERKLTVKLRFKSERMQWSRDERRTWRGLLPILEDWRDKEGGKAISDYTRKSCCPECAGTRLNAAARSVLFRGRQLPELEALSLHDLHAFIAALELGERERLIGTRLLQELRLRLLFLVRVGLGYLTTDRSAATLSGGESQRVRLATQAGSGLRGVLYVLDEPSIGLHARDNARLIETLQHLRDAGNTVLVVEHDEETMLASDHLIDLGPGAGRLGGRVLASGPPVEVAANPASITGAWLRGERRLALPLSRRSAGPRRLVLRDVHAHNLQHVDVEFPAGLLIAVTGVSGSGKSTLVDGVLRPALARVYHGAEDEPLAHGALEGSEHFDKVVVIDQSPIGRTPRSNPATYTGLFDDVRALFAELPEARERGWKKGRFSFNVKGGRCEACEGAGVKVVPMHFLADVEVTCSACDGRRFTDETLALTWKGQSIADVLAFTIDEALEFFAAQPRIRRSLETLARTGLGYIHLGQTSTTLSGGEAQRIKLATELQRPATGRTLYLLDEPTTGLHAEDVCRLVAVLQSLVDAGNTVVVVEHNMDVIQSADWIIDLGPAGGSGGGRVVHAGSFESMLAVPGSHTGAALRAHLGRSPATAQASRAAESTPREYGGDVVVEGATLHNLQVKEARFPEGRMSVVTGLSGSGKTSLAFNTLFAEGQRRFVECLSTYARQFLGRLERPPVDAIRGLAPAIAIDQKSTGRSPRSTVATVTEIQDGLRLLFARRGVAHCPRCDAELGPPVEAAALARRVLAGSPGAKGRLLSPLHVATRGWHQGLEKLKDLPSAVEGLKAAGWRRLVLDGVEHALDDALPPLKGLKEAWLVLDRLVLKESALPRVLEAVELALKRSPRCAFLAESGALQVFSAATECLVCNEVLPEDPTPRHFSFNSHQGACSACNGLGESLACDPERLLPRPEQPLFEGAMVDRPGDFLSRADSWFRHSVEALAAKRGVDLEQPWKKLPLRFRREVLDGSHEDLGVVFDGSREDRRETVAMTVRWKGFARYIEEWHRTSDKPGWVEQLEPLMRRDCCPECAGERLKPWWRGFRVGGERLAGVAGLTVTLALAWVERVRAAIPVESAEARIGLPILAELERRLSFLANVGLEYLHLGRNAATLSGGEAQRIRLATQLGNQLSGVLYVLDEPTIGLHPCDTGRLLGTLHRLRDLGNTLVVVEHDRDTIAAADWAVDMGPGAGHEGGRVVWQGPAAQLASADSITGRHLRGELGIAPAATAPTPHGWLKLSGAKVHNLKQPELALPLGVLTTVSGVSGAGKSSLVMDALAVALKARDGDPAHCGRVAGALPERVVCVDQAALAATARSHPASHLGIFDRIRALFAEAPLARERGYGPGRFSFNTREGRCAACEGRGSTLVEMHFLPDVEVPCESCHGQRYNRETLDVEWRGQSIAAVLAMEAAQAAEFFAAHPRIAEPLQLLTEIGLGYMPLGRSASTLSGGEAQRLKLATELSTRGTNRLYLLDEPTTGLHFEDVRRLLLVLRKLVAQGHTVVLIEHNMDVVAAADHVLEMGPGGGDAGGEILFAGTPRELAREGRTPTGRALRALANSRSTEFFRETCC